MCYQASWYLFVSHLSSWQQSNTPAPAWPQCYDREGVDIRPTTTRLGWASASFSGSSDTNLKKSKLYASRTRGAVLDVRPSLSPMHLSLCTERVGRIANMVQRKISLVVCLQRCKQALEYFNTSQLAHLTLKYGIRIEKLSRLVSSSWPATATPLIQLPFG